MTICSIENSQEAPTYNNLVYKIVTTAEEYVSVFDDASHRHARESGGYDALIAKIEPFDARNF